MELVHVEYEGPPALVGRLAAMLEAEGFEVRYRPPIETKSHMVQDVVIPLAVAGVVGNLRTLLQLAAEQWAIRAEIKDQKKHED